MQRYDMPDKWRISEKQFNRFITILKGQDKEKKLRMLLRLEEELAVSPTYWYELSLAAYTANKKDILFNAIKKYEDLNDKTLRHNSQYSLMLANKITYLDPETQKEDIIKLLNKINSVDPLNPEMKLFSAMEYALIGDNKKAEILLNENIDDDFLSVLSQKMKLKLYIQENNDEGYKNSIEKLLTKQNLSVIDYLSFLGDKPIEMLVQEIEKELKKIDIGIDKSLYGKDSLIVQLPKKWVYNDITDTSVVVFLDDKEYKYTQLIDANDSLAYTFEDIVKYSDLKEKRIKKLILKIIYKDLPVQIKYNIKVEKPEINHIERSAEDNESNDSSFFDSSISYLSTKKADIYNKSTDMYSDYQTDIQFEANRINIKGKCFDVLNSLKPCK
jgi:hypothetical protein